MTHKEHLKRTSELLGIINSSIQELTEMHNAELAGGLSEDDDKNEKRGKEIEEAIDK